MRAVDIIIKKRDRLILTKEEIEFFVNGFTSGKIPDYQVSAWAMAVLLNGMTDEETTDLTLAMANSGTVLDLDHISKVVIDKHSTGGVGDKTSLVAIPLVASCGITVGKISGRGLGFSGGTLDKLESIPGLRTDLGQGEFLQQLLEIGIVISGQSDQLAPADGKLYSLRDVTGTVQSIPLIAASVMSKKIACGAQGLVLDVKVGVGAFIQSMAEARRLAELMVKIGRICHKNVTAILSDMNQPLGKAVGNALELHEAIQTLKGCGPADLEEHCLMIASQMVILGDPTLNLETARQLCTQKLRDGSAWNIFRKMVAAQGGDISYVDDTSKLISARHIETIPSPHTGYIREIHARKIGEASMLLGAGRFSKGDIIDHSVGIMVHQNVGDKVQRGDPLFTLYTNDQARRMEAKGLALEAYRWRSRPCRPLPLFYDLIK